jgi:hypothetical protein
VITEYTPVSWAPNDPITTEKLNTMVANTQLLFERTPKTLYNAHGIVKDKGVKIFSAKVTMPAGTTANSWARVYFGNFFSVGCQPVITIGVNAYGQTRYHHNFSGVGPVTPDHRGVDVRIQADEINPANNKVSKALYMNIIAIGW